LGRSQTRDLQLASSFALGNLSIDVITSLTSIAVATHSSWRLTLALLATLPAATLALTLLNRRLPPALAAQTRLLVQASTCATVAIRGIDVVRVCGGADYETWKYWSTLSRAKGFTLAQARTRAYQVGIAKLWLEALFIAGFYYGTVLVRHEYARPGDIVTAFYATLGALQAVEAFVPIFSLLGRGMTAGYSLRKLCDGELGARPAQSKGRLRPRSCPGRVAFHDVSWCEVLSYQFSHLPLNAPN
jgi:ATP-binding cassette subfamily B (MDR/TAP) protein 1